ncbi:GNAT family N-acetyltransferase [Pseudoalteromonas denitrificans]|uniref:Acetyltransferase (GNAT) family protein n=1 Tax=Pseudoalteromonas denitrificans DSM 6059 TaxID=1123010 RepID=A0A1I1KFD0_9GAMM|nr:GNAT family N-acetyltransferase [Pseudoalteromonas denitrificans]SFC57418.1 Acetyltransferase (GNAT) family protein [Pseudoalteromonas denitrificans DSM 6059]
MNIELTTSASKEDKKIVSQGIIAFNKHCIPDLEPNEDEVNFSVFARNDSNKITGGIRCICYWNTLHIELLWLSEECRGQGIGKKLIEKAEFFAKQNGCEKAFVETTSWQAKPFYEKSGYEHVATLPERPKGHASHYLTKTLI